MLAVAPFDWQLTDSYFVVGHFHFVLIGGLFFATFAAIYYWFPKATGRMLSERLGRWHFWLFVIGFILTFLTMHVPGLLGMPRRIYTYQADRGWEMWNLITTLGVPLQIAATLIFVVNVVVSLRRGQAGGRRPVGRLDARVGHDLAAAVLQLRDAPGGHEPPAALGPEASGRPGRTARMNAHAATHAGAVGHEWRGRAGMIGLIIAEGSLFAVFVVAYLFYMGKSLNGPYPKDVLDIPLVGTICLFASSATVALRRPGARAWRRPPLRPVAPGDGRARRHLPGRDRPRVVPAHLS